VTACEHDHSNLLAYRRGELDEAAERAVAQHLLDCPAARAEYAELTEVDQLLSVSPDGEPLPGEFFLEGSPDTDRPGGGAVLQGALARVHAERAAGRRPPSIDNRSPGTLPTVEQARYRPQNGHAPHGHALHDPPWLRASTAPAPIPHAQQPWPPHPPAQQPRPAPASDEGEVADLTRRQRRRRAPALIAAAAIVLALVAGVSAVTGRATAPAVVIAAPTVATAGPPESQFTIRSGDITAAAILAPAQGWVRVALTTTGIPAGQRCSIVVITRDGTETAAGSWVVPVNEPPTGPPTVSGSAAVPADAVAAIEIRDPAGEQLVSIPTV
jgi:hypothetical protein